MTTQKESEKFVNDINTLGNTLVEDAGGSMNVELLGNLLVFVPLQWLSITLREPLMKKVDNSVEVRY